MTQSEETSVRKISAKEWWIAFFTAGYMAASLFATAWTGNKEFLFYFIVMIVLISVVCVVHFQIKLPNAILTCLSLWGLMHMAGGLAPIPESWPIGGETYVLYNWYLIPNILKYDQVVHAFGFGTVTWVCWTSIKRLSSSIRPTLGPMILAAAGGMGFGALNEMIEFIATVSLPDTNVGGYHNTGLDLVANLVGCTLSCLLIAAFDRRN